MTFRMNRQVFQGSSRTKSTPEGRQFVSGKESVRLIGLGGSGNVTKNMYVYEHRYDGKLKDILIVDCGIGFPDPEMYGVDIVIPDSRYLWDKKNLIRGLVFTHGHDDHIGGIPYVYSKLGKVPMWATPLAAAFTNIKLKEAKVAERVTAVSFDQKLTIGPFRVGFIRVTHSVPDTAHLVIETPVGIFYHGSDFKFDFDPLDGKLSEIEKINEVGRRGVLCLLTDSLGSERVGFTESEQVVGESLERELRMCAGKFIFTTQSSNVSRIQRAIEIALRNRRQIAFFGRSIEQNIEAALKLAIMKFPGEFVIRDRDLKRLPREKQFLLVAGAQGQPESAISRMANDEHKYVKIEDGDTVFISADPIPGNEFNVNNLIEQLYRKNARVAYSNIMEDLHVSGHGSQGDLMMLLSAVGPKYVVPIGGTYRHMVQYRRLAEDLGYDKTKVIIPEEGEAWEFRLQEKPRVTDKLELENVMVDGIGVGDVGHAVLRDRQTIATEGIVVIVVPVSKSSGRVTAEPDIVSRGFVYMKESTQLMSRAKQVVAQSMRLKKGRIGDWQFVKKQIEMNVANFLSKETGRFPLIVPVIVEV